MKSKRIDKKYKVDLSVYIHLEQIRDYGDHPDFEKLVEKFINDGEFINSIIKYAGSHLEDSYSIEDVPFDYLDFKVTSCDTKNIEQL